MKLYELPQQTYFTLKDDPKQWIYFLDHIDGLYSVCYDNNDNLIHISALADVQIVRPIKTYAGETPNYAQVNV
jgi:hypothetical protein